MLQTLEEKLECIDFGGGPTGFGGGPPGGFGGPDGFDGGGGPKKPFDDYWGVMAPINFQSPGNSYEVVDYYQPNNFGSYQLEPFSQPQFNDLPQFGLLNEKPFQGAYDLPGSGAQLHLHGPNPNTFTEGSILGYDRKAGPLAKLNGYEASMAAFNAEALGFKKIKF